MEQLVFRKDKLVSRKEYLVLGKKDLCFLEKFCVSQNSFVLLEKVYVSEHICCSSSAYFEFRQLLLTYVSFF